MLPQDSAHHSLPRVYVFNSTFGCSGFVDAKFRWQQEARWLIPDEMLVESPDVADVLYHPACLVDAYFNHRSFTVEWRSASRLVENRVLDDLAPYWRTKHIVVNALRCTNPDVGGARVAFRTLWRWPPVARGRHDAVMANPLRGSAAPWVARVCGETWSFGRAEPDQPCSIYMPYLTDAAKSPEIPSRTPAQRDIDILFVGSEMPKRWFFLQAMRNMSATHAIRILSLSTRSSRQLHRAAKRVATARAPLDEKLSSAASALMARARFTLCPPGDTLESQRIYQALQHGSIPLIHDRFSGPSFLNWSAISYPLHVRHDGQIQLPDAQLTTNLHTSIVEAVVRRGDLLWRSDTLSTYVGAQFARVARECFGGDERGQDSHSPSSALAVGRGQDRHSPSPTLTVSPQSRRA